MQKAIFFYLSLLLLVVSACHTSQKSPAKTSNPTADLAKDPDIIRASEASLRLMLLHDSLQVYYRLCIDEIDSCKPKLYVSGNSLSRVASERGTSFGINWRMDETRPYLEDFEIPLIFTYSPESYKHWIDYWLYFRDLYFEKDSGYIEFEMRVMDGSIKERGGHRESPEFGIVHPRRRYPEIRVKLSFIQADSIWKVDNFDLEHLPPYDNIMLQLQQSRIPRKDPRTYCVEQPIEVDLEEERRKMNWPLDSFWKDDY